MASRGKKATFSSFSLYRSWFQKNSTTSGLVNPRPTGLQIFHHLQYSTKAFGALEPHSRFLAISPKQMQISTPNFQHPLSHQYHTLCENLKVHGIIGRPQMTSEWHNVPSISTPPRTQFLSYDQLTYMTCLRISRAIKLISRIFQILKIGIFKNYIFSFFLRISPSKSNFPKNRNTSWMAMANEYVHKISSRY